MGVGASVAERLSVKTCLSAIKDSSDSREASLLARGQTPKGFHQSSATNPNSQTQSRTPTGGWWGVQASVTVGEPGIANQRSWV